jgi:hypothetical protein
MIRLAAVILAAVELGAGFGDASATVESLSDESMVVDMRVEVTVEADVVVAHFALPDEDQITIPLLLREDGTYGVTTELKPADYQVVFEAVGDPGAQSEPVALSDLGADLGTSGGTDDEGTSKQTSQWLWLGVALGAASLSALAFWVLGARDDKDEDEDEEDAPDQVSPEEPTSVS